MQPIPKERHLKKSEFILPTIISTDIKAAADLLIHGEVVAIPTETVYGLAANAMDAAAVVQIFEIKNRPHFDPLIVHVSSIEAAAELVESIPDFASKLMENFWPGPLTIVMKKKSVIPDIVTSGLSTVGLRMPNHPMALKLLQSLDFPLAAPSANPFGYISPTTSAHVLAQLGEKIPMILEGNECTIGLESTIVDCSEEIPVVLRLGGTSIEALESVIGKIMVSNASGSAPAAPGMLISHYAPRKKLLIGDIDMLIQKHSGQRIGVLSFSKSYPLFRNEILSESANLNEAARRLFSCMRALDESDVQIILAEYVTETGLGRAINDRLQRAEDKN